MKSKLSLVAAATTLSLVFITTSAFATDIIIFDGMLNPLAGVGGPGVRVLENGNKVGNPLKRLFVSEDAKSADRNIRATLNFYQNEFNRNSYDNNGGRVDATVRAGALPIDLFGMNQNAAWTGKRFVFGSGDKYGLDNFVNALDVIAHEFTHAVIQYTSALNYEGQSGALNEHFADLFGEMAQQKVRPSVNREEIWLIGESTLTPVAKAKIQKALGRPVQALRNMLIPSEGLDSQPGHMSQIEASLGPSCKPTSENDRCGVHKLSGIPNRASALIVSQLGWERTKWLFYNVMTKRLRSNSQFADYAREMMGECYSQLSPYECTVVSESFREVGL